MPGDSVRFVPLGSSERFVCRFADEAYFWTYHDERGRLLVRGPSHAEQWEAHRRLLAAIQDEATAGALVNAGDESQDELQGGLLCGSEIALSSCNVGGTP